MSDRLVGYYDGRHQEDLDLESLELSPLGLRRPKDRFQAAVADLPARIPTGADILELGAGDGRVAESLRVGGVEYASYTIVELSPVRLAGLERHLTDGRYRFLRGDADDIGAATSDTYHVVIMLALVEHLIDPMHAMAEIRRLLRPGGFAYIETPNIAKWTRRARLAVGRFPSTAAYDEGLVTHTGQPATLYDEGHLHYFTYRSLERMLTERCGFSRVERLGYFNGPYRIPTVVGAALARRWPTMFGEVAVAAWA